MIRPSEPTSSPRATPRDWIGLGVLILPCIVYSMDLTVLNLAVPALTADLRPTASQLLWIVDIYGFLVAGWLITMGTLGDRIGRRKLLLIGAATFAIASICAAYSTSPTQLILSRAALGIAAATLAPSTLSLIRNMFLDSQQRTVAIGIWVAGFSAGAAVGPLIGGALLSQFDWGAVFLINVPIMGLLLLLGPLLLPEFRAPGSGRLDLPSAALSLLAVLSVIYGVKRLAVEGFDLPALLAIAAGLTIGAAFVRRQRRLADPMIDLALFERPGFSAALTTNIMALFIAFGFFLFIAQYLQLVLGFGPLEAGLWTTPSGLAFVAGSMLVAPVAARYGKVRVVASGFVLSAVGFTVLAVATAYGGVVLLTVGFVLFCFGLAPIGTLTTDMVMSATPPERAGAASAISETSFELGGALGIAVLGSLMNGLYRSSIAGTLPAELSSAASTLAADTLSGAVRAASELAANGPSPLADAVVAAARAAYVEAFAMTAIACVLLSLIAAALAARNLRSIVST